MSKNPKENLNNKPSRGLVKWLKLLFTPIALIAIISAGWFHRETLEQILLTAQVLPLAISVIVWMVLHAVSPFITQSLFLFLNESINYRQAFLIHNKRLPTKYLPGGIWHTVARATDYHSMGIRAPVIGTYLIIENILQVLITFFIGSIIVLNVVNSPLVELALQLILIMSLVVLVIGPFLIQKFSSTSQLKIRTQHYVSAILISIIYWSIASTAFVIFLSAFSGLQTDISKFETGGAYLFSWAVGYIAIFAPQGIGVSELVFTTILAGKTGAMELVAFIATFRVIVLSGDLIAWTLSLIVEKFSRKN